MKKSTHQKIWKWSALPMGVGVASMILEEHFNTIILGGVAITCMILFIIMFWFVGVMGAVASMMKKGLDGSIEQARRGSLESEYYKAARNGLSFFEMIGLVPTDSKMNNKTDK